MWPVLMDINVINPLAKYIASQVRALIDDKTLFAQSLGKTGKCGAKKAGADNQIVKQKVHLFNNLPMLQYNTNGRIR